jgi:hypothetical protein
LRTIQNCNSYNKFNALIRDSTPSSESARRRAGVVQMTVPRMNCHIISGLGIRTLGSSTIRRKSQETLSPANATSRTITPCQTPLQTFACAHHRNFSRRFALRLVFLTGFVPSELSRKTSISQD